MIQSRLDGLAMVIGYISLIYTMILGLVWLFVATAHLFDLTSRSCRCSLQGIREAWIRRRLRRLQKT